VDQVVHDNVAAGRAQIPDVLRKLRGAAAASGKEQFRLWGQVRDDFKHRRAFAGAESGLAGQDGNGRDIARSERTAEKVDAVGKHAHLDARSRGAEVRTR